MKHLLLILITLTTSFSQASDLMIQTSKTGEFGGITLSNTGSYVATFGQLGYLRIWDSHSGMLLDETHMGFYNRCNKISFSEDSKYVYCYSHLGTIVRNWQDRKTIYRKGNDFYTLGMAVDSSKMCFYVAAPKKLYHYSLESGVLLGEHDMGNHMKGEIAQINLTNSGNVLLFSLSDGMVQYEPKSKTIIDQINFDYPQSRVFDDDSVSKMPEALREEGKNLKRVLGSASWIPDKNREKMILTFQSQRDNWMKVMGQTKESISQPVPLDENIDVYSWVGKTGRVVTYSNTSKNISILNPATNENHKIKPTDFARDEITTGIDCDQSGETMVVSTTEAWYCFERDEGNVLKWKERKYKSIPAELCFTDICPATNRLLYPAPRGKAMALTLDSKLASIDVGTLNNNITLLKSFRNGQLIAATNKEYFLLNEGMPRKVCKVGLFPVIERCGNHILLDSTSINSYAPKYTIIDDKGIQSNELTFNNTRPIFHSGLPIFFAASDSEQSMQVQLFKIGENGNSTLLHDISIDGDAAVEAIPEGDNSFLAFQYDRKLVRVNLPSGEAKLLRETNHECPSNGHLSPDGKYIVALDNGTDEFPCIVPLDKKKPIQFLTISNEHLKGAEMIGFTGNGKGVWLNVPPQEIFLWDVQSRSACLFDVATGKSILSAKVYENSAAILYTEDGHCLFNELATELVHARKLGQTDISKVSSEKKLIDILKNYGIKP